MLNIDCFGDNYIGIKFGCDTDTPTSGLYIDSLPGINLKLAAKLADAEAKTGQALIRQLEEQAIREVWQDIKVKLTSGVQINKTIETRTVGCHRQDIAINYLPVQAAEVGLEVEKNDCDPYTAIRINYVDIRADSTVAGKTLTITDGCTTSTYTYDITAGCPVRVYTNFTGFGGPIRITTDASDLELENMYLSGGCGCISSCRCTQLGCFSVRGWDGTQEVSSANGMVVNASCTCDESAILCSLQNDICMAVQLRLGILLLMEQLNTKRCNYFVLNSQEEARNQLLMWMGGVNMEDGFQMKSQYGRLITETANSIQESLKGTTSDCIMCAGLAAIETVP